MTDWSRLTNYIYDYFPEPKYSPNEVRDWAIEHVPSWKYLDDDTKDGIVKDWEDFIAKPLEEEIEEYVEKASPTFLGRIKKFLGRLFGFFKGG